MLLSFILSIPPCALVFHSVLQKYGFLYTGYNLRRGLYFWELLVLARKVFIAALSVFNIAPFLQVSIFLRFHCYHGCQPPFPLWFAQAYISSVAFTIFLLLHVHVKPFTSPILNALEALSLISTAVTQVSYSLFRFDVHLPTSIPSHHWLMQMGSILFTTYPEQEVPISVLLLSVNILTIIVFGTFLVSVLLILCWYSPELALGVANFIPPSVDLPSPLCFLDPWIACRSSDFNSWTIPPPLGKEKQPSCTYDPQPVRRRSISLNTVEAEEGEANTPKFNCNQDLSKLHRRALERPVGKH